MTNIMIISHGVLLIIALIMFSSWIYIKYSIWNKEVNKEKKKKGGYKYRIISLETNSGETYYRAQYANDNDWGDVNYHRYKYETYEKALNAINDHKERAHKDWLDRVSKEEITIIK